MGKDSTHQKFTDALDKLVRQLKEDRSILAVILCGSLAYDKVWAKSDIDLALVSIDDKKVEEKSIALNADGVNVHAFLVPRALFRKLAEGSLRNSFMHSLLAKGRLLYTQDETIAEVFAALEEIGERDTQVQLLTPACTHSVPSTRRTSGS
jgi:predicted nucleotidyltransferase